MFKNEKEAIRFATRQIATEVVLLAIRATETAAQHLLHSRIGIIGPPVSIEEQDGYRVAMKHCRIAATKVKKVLQAKIPVREVKVDGEIYDSLGHIWPVIAWFLIVGTGRNTGPAWEISQEDNYIRVGSLHPGQIKFSRNEDDKNPMLAIREIDQSKDSHANEVDFSHL